MVTYATADGTAIKTLDYSPRTGVLIFPPGALTRTFAIPVIGDRVHEPTKTFTVNLSSPSNATIARGQGIGTIIDNDPDALVGFQAAHVEVSESSPGATIVVTRTGSATAAFTVQYETVDATAHAGVDYVATTGTLSFPAGVMTRSFALKVLPNTKMDGRRTLMLRLFNVSAQAGLDRSTLPVIITDDDVGGVVRFSSAAYSVNEGAGLATITVVRTGGAASAVTVDYATGAPASGVPATAGTDFTAVSGTLTFAAGQTSRTFTIPIAKDTIDEPNETVGLALSNVTGGATLGTPSAATLTIMDDDVGGVFQFAATAMTVVEGKQASIVVTRSGGLAGPVTVDWAVSHISTDAADFSPIAGTLTFAAGVTSQTILLTINDDGINEGPEQFVLLLGNATGGAGLGVRRSLLVTVNDKQLTQPTIHFSTPVYNVVEGGIATIVVRRSGPTTGKVTVDYATADGTATVADGDYTARSGTLTFNPGVTAMSFTVPTTNDSRVEGDQQLGLILSNVTGGTLGTQRTATLIIRDNDVGGVIRFSSAVYSVGENAGAATITVVRTGGAAGPVTIDYATTTTASGVAATAGTDFTAVSGTLTFAAGQTVRTFTIPIAADTIDEQNKTVGLVLTNVTGGATLGAPNKATLTILDDDVGGVIQFAASAMSVVEGGQASIVVTRTGGLAGPVTVDWNALHLSTDATDFSPVTGTLTFAAGVTSQSIVLTIPDDGVEEGPEKFVLVLSNPTGAATIGARHSMVVTINDKTLTQPTIHFTEPGYTVVEGGIATITVRRSGPTAGKVTVNYATADDTATVADGDYTARSGTLTFAPGVTAASFTVPTTADTRVEGNQRVKLALSGVTGGQLGTQQTASLVILDNDIGGLIRFSAPVYTVTEGAKLATITVTRTGGAASGVSVDYTATTPLVGIPAVPGTDFTTVTGTLTFAAGQTSRTFTVPILQDTVDEPAKDVRLVLSNVQGGAVLVPPSTAKISITDDDVAGNVRFAATSWSANRDALTVTVKLVRSGGAASEAKVQYATVNGSAVAGTDFTQTAGSVIFGANETEKLITVPLISNPANLDVRSFSIGLGATANGLTLGTPSQTTVFLVAPH